jgi:diaminopimelate decarboxylase
VGGRSGIAYRGQDLCCDDVPLASLAATYGTPTYVYSLTTILERFDSLERALSSVRHRVCYAVKTNSNLGILGALARAGAGFDIVSAGELARLSRVGAPPQHMVYAGVGKTAEEMRRALDAGVGTFNIESLPEAELLSAIATQLGHTARVALRVNPDVAAGGHHYIATGTSAEKFGIPLGEAVATFGRIAALPHLEPRGLHCHVGSQILDMTTYRDVARVLAGLVRTLRAGGHEIDDINIGGGLGIRYHDEDAPTPESFAAAVLPEIAGLDVRLLVEPGRYLVGNAGALLARVLYHKATDSKRFVVVDAGMNDLVRPSLYGAHHEILPVRRAPDRDVLPMDVVGPLCESGDFLARNRALPVIEPGEWLAICSAGAYGFSMSSNYNSRPRAAEILVRGGQYQVVRERETYEDLMRGESDWSRS